MTRLTLKIHSLKFIRWSKTDQRALLSNIFFLISIFFIFEKKKNGYILHMRLTPATSDTEVSGLEKKNLGRIMIGPQEYEDICLSIKGCRIHRDQCQVP